VSLRKSIRKLVAWLERGKNRWNFVRKVVRPLGHGTHEKIRKRFIAETIPMNPEPVCLIGVNRRIEVWRPVGNLTSEQMKDAKAFAMIGGVEKALIDVDEKLLDFKDMVVDAGLDALCGQAFDSSGSRPAVFNYVAIGTDNTAPAAGQTALGAEVMREQGTYSKDAATGECSMDNEFSITNTYALNECGLFNAPSGGTMYCRDTYTTKNVVSGDTVKVNYTPKFQRPA